MQFVEKLPNGKRKFISLTLRLYYKAKNCTAPSTANNVVKISLQRLPGNGGALSEEDRGLKYKGGLTRKGKNLFNLVS